jgi:hypothetical protein
MSFSEAVAQRGLNSPYDWAIATAANAYGVDPALIKAVISQESNWVPTAYRAEPRVNDASYGLMQILLATAKAVTGNPALTSNDLFQPEINIDIGTRFLAQVLSTYGSPNGISAYNAGRPISGNQSSYVEPVLAYQAWYQANDPLFGNPPVPPGDNPGGVIGWIENLFGTTENPPAGPLIDPVTGEVITPDTFPTDILSGLGAGAGVILLGIGAILLLRRR